MSSEINKFKIILFYAIHIAYISFVCLSLYDIYNLHHNDKDNVHLRNIQSLATASVSILVGMYIIYKMKEYASIVLIKDKYYHTRPKQLHLDSYDKPFIFSSGLFLFITGITSIVVDVKRLEKKN